MPIANHEELQYAQLVVCKTNPVRSCGLAILAEVLSRVNRDLRYPTTVVRAYSITKNE